MMEGILALCVLVGGLYFVVRLIEQEQNIHTSKSKQTKNYKKEIALGLECLAQKYEKTQNIIDAEGFFSSSQDKNAWSYTFEIEIAYFQLIIFKHCIMLYDRSRIGWLEYEAGKIRNETMKKIWMESTSTEMEYEYRKVDIAKEKGQNIAKGIEYKWIMLILKLYGLNYNENNISVVKKLLKEREDFYIDILEQQMGKKKETYNGDSYIKFLEFCEQHYEFRGNRGFEKNYIPVFMQMYQAFLEQSSMEKVVAGFMYAVNNEYTYFVRSRFRTIKLDVFATWDSAVKYRQMSGNPLPSNSQYIKSHQTIK